VFSEVANTRHADPRQIKAPSVVGHLHQRASLLNLAGSQDKEVIRILPAGVFGHIRIGLEAITDLDRGLTQAVNPVDDDPRDRG